MDAAEVLEKARSGSVPSGWSVWPLQRGRVVKSLLWWAFTGVLGTLLFIGAALSTIPDNFKQGNFLAAFTVVLLALLGAMGFGGLGLAIYDAWRLIRADEFLLVVTPDEYVQKRPGKLTYVPLENVGNITLKGTKAPIDEAAEQLRQDTEQMNSFARLAARFNFQRRPRTAPMLAFMDLRDDKVVVVSKDDSFDDLYVIEDVLSLMVSAKRRSRPA